MRRAWQEGVFIALSRWLGFGTLPAYAAFFVALTLAGVVLTWAFLTRIASGPAATREGATPVMGGVTRR